MGVKPSLLVTSGLLFLTSNIYLIIVYSKSPTHRIVQNQTKNSTVGKPEKLSFEADDAPKLHPEGFEISEKYIPDNVTPIPRIIHQFWDSYNVPGHFVSWIKSWVKYNPEYEYWFWTPDDIRSLMKDNNMEDYLDLYNSYPRNQSRANVGRYLIMAFIGGFYADLDMDCLKPLEPWRQYGCIVSEETYSHTYLLHLRSGPSIMNTFLGCHPNHDFYRYLPTGLKDEVKLFPKDVLKQCGVRYFDKMHQKFKNESLQKPDIKSPTDFLLVLPPKFFLPTQDPGYCWKCICSNKNIKSRTALEQCSNMKMNDYKIKPLPESYANHHWVHVIVNETKWRSMKSVPIQEVVPNVKTYRDIVNGGNLSKYFVQS